MANATMAITIKARDLATKGIKSAGSAVKGMTRSLFSLKGAMAAIAGGFGAFKFSQEFIEANSTLEQMRFRMDALLGSAERGEKAFEFIRKFQRENPIGSIQEMTSAFEGLVVAGIDPASGALEALITGSRKFGLTEDAVKGVTVALRQMSAKGNLQAEELNQLAERLPGIYKKLANELGFGENVKKFQDDMKKRLIGGQEASLAVIRVLSKEGEGVAEEYANTWQAKVTQLKSLWFDFMIVLGDTGLFDDFKNAITKVSNFVKNNTQAVANVFGQLRAIVVEIWDQIGESVESAVGGVAVKQKIEFLIDGFLSIVKWAGKVGIYLEAGLKTAWNAMAKLLDALSGFKLDLAELGVLDESSFYDAETAKRLNEYKSELDEVEKKLKNLARTKRANRNAATKAAFEDLKETKELRQSISDLNNEILLIRQNVGADLPVFENIDKNMKEKLATVEGLYSDFSKRVLEVRKKFKGSEVDTTLDMTGPAGTKGIGLLDSNTVDSSLNGAERFFKGWGEALKEAKDKYDFFMDDMTQTGKFMAKTVTGALSTQFDSFFTDLIDGKMKSFKDAIIGFLKDIAKAMSQAFSQKLSAQIMGGLGTAIGGMFQQPKVQGPVEFGQGRLVGPYANAYPQSTLAPSFRGKQSVEIINNTDQPVQASKATVRQDVNGQIMSIVLDSVRTNKGGARQALKASLM